MKNLTKLAYNLESDVELASLRFDEDIAVLNFFFDTPIITQINMELKTNNLAKVTKSSFQLFKLPYSDALLAPSDATLAPLHQGRLLVPGRNWPIFFCLVNVSAKMAK